VGWTYTETNLTDTEIKSARKGDFSFIGSEKRKQELWTAEFNRRRDIAVEYARGPRIDVLTMPQDEMQMHIGMENCPAAPEYDYMRCWHEQWNSRNSPGILKSRNDYNCRFYYPIKNKGEKSFDGCHREQQDEKISKNMRIGFWTLAAAVAGIVVTLILRFV